MFFANPSPVERMRINHFLKVEPPVGRLLLDLEHRVEQFSQIMASEEGIFNQSPDESEEIQIIATAMNDAAEPNPIERGVSALLAFHNRHTESEQQETIVEEEEVDTGHVNIFKKPALTAAVMALVGPSDMIGLSLPLVNKSYIKDKIELMERILGRSGSQASNITREIIKDML